MQRQVWQALTRIARRAKGETVPDDLGDDDTSDDFGFYHPPNAVLDCFQALRVFSVLPQAGGWLDQDERWQHDLLLMYRLYADAQEEEDVEPLLPGEESLGVKMGDMFGDR